MSVLSPVQFVAVASGYGDAGAIAVLNEGQLAKRKTLVAMVGRDARGTEHAAVVAAAMEVLARAEEADPAAVDAVLAHPHVDSWAMACLNGLADLADGRAPADLAATVGHLAAIATAAALAAGVAFDVEVPTRFGVVAVPGLGEAVGLGDGPARAAGDAGGARFEGAHGAVVRIDGPGWRPRRVVALAGGHALAIEDQDPYRDCYGYRPLPYLGEAEADHLAKLLQDAWLLIERDHPAHAAAMRAGLGSVVPVSHGGMMVSSASRHAYGSIAMSVPDTAADVALLMIHEHLHAKLGGLLDLMDLHSGGGHAVLYAPWRLDPRPAGALLQGVYAHAGVTDYWRCRRRSADGDTARAEAQFVYWGEMNRLAAHSLINSGELTPAGEQFVTVLAGTLDGWAAEEVYEPIAFHARLFVLAQTVRWRLLNWQPDDAEPGLLLDAVRAGQRTDRLGPAGTVPHAAPVRPVDATGILGVLRPWLDGRTDPVEAAAPGPDDAGAMLLRHDPDGADRACVARLDRDGADVDAWLGLAIARAWIGHRERRPDPLAELLERRPDVARAAVLKLQSANSRHAASELVAGLVSPPGGA
ncbi:HEXXH motif-containing putative peptide modification protein [Dactylosporangium sp. NPDC000555]|uniref:aKG-HExxH-type peptide beta-hydroxylase n=1 Tax=Dactylosporangium sp. NPDC000555 TaxID=3154260 RepID=UPI00331FAFA4